METLYFAIKFNINEINIFGVFLFYPQNIKQKKSIGNVYY